MHIYSYLFMIILHVTIDLFIQSNYLGDAVSQAVLCLKGCLCEMNSHMSVNSIYFFRQERLKFWSDPDTELKLAKETGVSVFRMGVDWTRIMPKEPTEDFKSSVS